MVTTDDDAPRPHRPVGQDVLAEQISYYRARATEYDQWFNREGRYDRGQDATHRWRRELDEVRLWLKSLDLAGRSVLELAPGTGLWTRHLVEVGAEVTAVDAAPEMLEQLQQRLGGDRLTCIEADLFEWSSPRRYDAVVSCFFVSHIPDERLDGFLTLVHDALVPSGKVFLLDGLRTETSTASNHVLPEHGNQTMRRVLDDGRAFTIVKRFRTDDELRAACTSSGLEASIRRTETYFQAAIGSSRTNCADN